MTALSPGDLVAGRFEIERRAARGGTSLVYRARDRASGAQVALKISSEDPRSFARVAREAAMLQAVSHPRVVAHVAHGDGSGRAFVASSWLEGVTLDELISRRRLSPRECAALALALVEALRAMHEAGIAHGDVTPANVFLPGNTLAEAMLVDLGAAHRLDGDPTVESAAGTLGFMAPERILGGPASPGSDVFGLGCALFLALTGAAPFGADPDATPARTLVQDAPRAWSFDDSLPVELDVLLARMLARGPADRPGLAEVQGSLAAVVAALAMEPGASRPRVAGAGRPVVPSLARPAAPREGEPTLLGAASPFIGRAQELARIEEELARVRTGRASCLVVIGAPGIGKSRLRDELVAGVAERWPDLTVWRARADPRAAEEPLALLEASLRGAARLGAAERRDAVHAKLRTFVARYAEPADVDRVARFLSEAVGSPEPGEGCPDLLAAREDPALLTDQVARAWIDLARGATAAGPLLWVLDDLHWADTTSLRVIDAALGELSARPLCVLAFTRPAPRALVSGASFLELGPLHPDACALLARHALGSGADGQRVASIATRSLGNPLHLEEILRAEVDGSGGQGSVLALAHVRMLRLDREKRTCLGAASVFDRPFAAQALAAVLGEDATERTVAHLLDALVAEEILVRASDRANGGDPEHGFRHELVREAAYATLDARERADVHRRAAEWLSDRERADARTVAEHYAAGGRPEKAARWYAIAASRAFTASEFGAAEACGEQAVACGASGALLGAARGVAAEAAWCRRDQEKARRCALEAKALLPPGGALWHGAVATLAATHGARGDVSALDALARDLLAARAEGGAGPSRALALGRVMGQLLLQGAADRSAEVHRTLEEEASLSGDHPTVRAWLHRARAMRALFAGDPASYLGEMEARLAILEAVGDERNAALSLVYIGNAYLALGGYERAEQVLRDALARAERRQLKEGVDEGRTNLAWALAHLGAVEESVRLYSAEVAAYERSGNLFRLGGTRTYLSRILAAHGDAAGAETEALAAAAVLAAPSHRRARALAALAHARLRRGDAGGALEASAEALRIVQAVGGMDEGESYCRLVHVEALEASGAQAEARAALVVARDELFARAARIADPTWRRSFLERVTENARTLALAEAWSV